MRHAVRVTDAIQPTDLQAETRYLLNRWDPIGVYDEVLNSDEYDCLIAPLLLRLSSGAGVEQVGEYLRNELEDHFGLDPAFLDSDDFVERLVSWYSNRS
jgi:hypothetical protein